MTADGLASASPDTYSETAMFASGSSTDIRPFSTSGTRRGQAFDVTEREGSSFFILRSKVPLLRVAEVRCGSYSRFYYAVKRYVKGVFQCVKAVGADGAAGDHYRIDFF